MDTEENKVSFLDAEELVSLARRYYATRFPNSQRLGCPPEGEIARVVRQRQIPDQPLREHMFECSECFGEYRQLLAQHRSPAIERGPWRNGLATIKDRAASIGSWKISAASAVLILSSLIVIFILPKDAPEYGKDAGASSGPSEPRVGDVAQDGKGSTLSQTVGGGGAQPQSEDLTIAGVNIPAAGARRHETIDVDLDSYQSFRQSLRGSVPAVSGDRFDGRGSKLQGENIISLPATRARMVLRLPETAAPGKYKVSLIDAFGKPLLSTSAFSHDGSKLRVALDLRHISPKKYRLCLERDGEAPAIYNVIIGAR